MTRGGARKGAGRPRLKVAKTANLCGVRVTPMDLANYRDAAKRSGMTLTTWVKHWLDEGLDAVMDAMIGGPRDIGPILEEIEREKQQPKKRKGKKS